MNHISSSRFRPGRFPPRRNVFISIVFCVRCDATAVVIAAAAMCACCSKWHVKWPHRSWWLCVGREFRVCVEFSTIRVCVFRIHWKWTSVSTFSLQISLPICCKLQRQQRQVLRREWLWLSSQICFNEFIILTARSRPCYRLWCDINR